MLFTLLCLVLFCVGCCFIYNPSTPSDLSLSPNIVWMEDFVSPWDTENISLDMTQTAICCEVNRPITDMLETPTKLTSNGTQSLDDVIGQSTDDQPFTRSCLVKMNVKELRGHAERLKVYGYAKLRKSELVEAILTALR